jgi:hypothetical protein
MVGPGMPVSEFCSPECPLLAAWRRSGPCGQLYPSRTLALPGEQAICMAKARSAVSGILGFALRDSTGFGRRPGSS